MTSPTPRSALIEQTIDELSAGVPRHLFGGRRPDLLVEARDGLEDAADAYRRAGLSEAEAEARAVEEFGDVDQLRAQYAAQLVNESVRSASCVLGLGYLLVLTVWALAGRLVPEQMPQGPRLAAMSFAWIGALAAAVTVLGWLSLRRRARAGDRPGSVAWWVGGAGVACVIGTWVASYVLQPWAERDVGRPSFAVLDGLEVFSAVATLVIGAVSLHCLWSAWAASRRLAIARNQQNLLKTQSTRVEYPS